MEEKANILVLGTSGAGKSTLINTVLGREAAQVGSGGHVTEKMEAYESEELNMRLIDSRGFEYNMWNTQRSVRDIREWMKEGLGSEKPRIHMLWFCVDATSKRFTGQTVKTLVQVKKEWPDVPIIVVLTKSFFPAEDEENIGMVRQTFEKFAGKTGMPIAIIPVLARAPKDENIEVRGIEELVDATNANIEDAVRASCEAVRKYNLKWKRIKAQAVTFGAALSASVIGAVPIDFSDAVILTPLETTLITAIAHIYNIDDEKDSGQKLVTRIVEAGTVSLAAKAAIGKLKLIPGIAGIASDVLNAIVAGSIVLGIGEASTVIMEKVWLGEIDTENREWIDRIVEGNMGKIVVAVTAAASKMTGKVKVKEILRKVFSLIGKNED